MRALTYHGAKDVRVDTVPDPVKVTGLLEMIGNGKLNPETIITHRLTLEDAVEGYTLFDEKQEDCRKVILTP